ncbi:MAG TPA: class IV adenylate cyclase [candidate division Zixibacteria bacterium]|nr:class IV adenylate cyclase [candidate division Zixibacteria bacterium]
MIDVEIKARCENQKFIRDILKSKGARFAGIDNQTDIYFKSNTGRLKLRKGNIEQSLVYYERENIKGIKPSEFILYKTQDVPALEKILRKSLSVLIEVHKTREMYFIENIKFNIDRVQKLGNFIEIEAMTEKEEEINQLKKIVFDYMKLFKITDNDLQSLSYSDLLLKEKNL